MFNVVEDFQELGELANRLHAPQQITNIEFIVISKHSIFQSNVRKWIRCDPINQRWAKFKHFFADVHRELRDTNAQVDKIGFHSANAIVKQIVELIYTKYQ